MQCYGVACHLCTSLNLHSWRWTLDLPDASQHGLVWMAVLLLIVAMVTFSQQGSRSRFDAGCVVF